MNGILERRDIVEGFERCFVLLMEIFNLDPTHDF